MAVLVSNKTVFVDGKKIYESIAPIDEFAILSDGMIILYDPNGFFPWKSGVGSSSDREPTEQELSDALSNVIKINFQGNVIWRVKPSLKPSTYTGVRSIGYAGLFEDENKKMRLVSGRYDYELDIDTGNTTPLTD